MNLCMKLVNCKGNLKTDLSFFFHVNLNVWGTVLQPKMYSWQLGNYTYDLNKICCLMS